jgi:hypothetical protein
MNMQISPSDGSGAANLVVKRKRRRQFKGLDVSEISVRREEARCLDTREADRQPIRGMMADVTFRGRRREVELVNLSPGGAMVASGLKPDLCEHLDLHLGNSGLIECLVRWVKGGRIGLEFAHETQLQCTDDERSALLLSVIQYAFPSDERFCPEPPAAAAMDARSAPRHPLIWAGELLYGPSSWQVRLRNISERGALLECNASLREGSEVLLDLGAAGSLTATVSWACGDHVGLEFDEIFDLQQLAKAMPRLTPATWSRPAYLINEAPPESAWEAMWNRMSIAELERELEGYLKR